MGIFKKIWLRLKFWERELIISDDRDEDYAYRVRGLISFYLRPSVTPRELGPLMVELKQAIKEVGGLYPWRGRTGPHDLDYLGDGKVVKKIPSDQPLICRFPLEPFGDLKRSELRAYEKYVQTLAQKLTEKMAVRGAATAVSATWDAKSFRNFRSTPRSDEY